MSSTSSSGSEDDRPRIFPFPPQPPPPPPPKPKKKKKTLPPQETIDNIWSRFSAPKFSQAITILPTSAPSANPKTKHPVPTPTKRDNVLVSDDFDRAVLECRTRVKKLIRECKRVNMRYRDDFDIDWDLKWEKGYCLNGLGNRKFEINGRAFSNPNTKTPKAVKRVHEIFDKPVFLKDKVSPADVRQGNLGDCWLMASLTALANMEVGLHRICVEYDTKVGVYGFVFHRDGEWIISIIDDKLYLKSPDWDSPSVQRHLLELTDREDVEKEYRRTYQTGSQALFFAHCADQNETWLPLLEKAYAKAHGDYASLGGGWIGEGLEDLTGGVTTELLTSDILDTDEFWEKEILQVNKEFLFGCSTGLLDGGYGTRDGISEGHAYVIMEARELSTGQRLLKLRNPWGKGKKGQWEGAWSDGSKEFTPEAQIELKHKFGNDSVFWISYEDLLRKYQHFDRTRLFMDCPDWRISQKWVSLEVPWKSEFQEMFRFVLKNESPVVLVLSQLDDRYYNGLQGQYNFRLQFRLHEITSPGDDDYIVRSHGNYLMDRSVVTELTTLEAGTYAVYIMVVGDRVSNRLSVEDIVKKECRKKLDNDKLAQVGVNYDYAHSRAAMHLEATTAARKAADKLKAREARIAARRKNWEKRHISRGIIRKQNKKNQAKHDKREAEELAKEKEEEAKRPKHKAVQTEDPKDRGLKISTIEEPGCEEDQKQKDAESSTTIDPGPEEHSKEQYTGPNTDDKIAQKVDSTKSDVTAKLAIPAPSPPPSSMSTIGNDNDKAVQTEDLSDSPCATATPKTSSIEEAETDDQTVPANRHNPPIPRLRRRPSDDSIVSTDFRRFPNAPRRRQSSRRYSYVQPAYAAPGMPGPGPPPPGRMNPHMQTRMVYVTSDGESSASPIDDYDDMYSDDDPTLKPRPITPANAGTGLGNGQGKKDESEDEDLVDAWNAVCIVGFRVYSQDPHLQLSIFDENLETLAKKVESKEQEQKEAGERDWKEKVLNEKDIVLSPVQVAIDVGKGEADGDEFSLRPLEEAKLVLVDEEKVAMGLASESVMPNDTTEHVTKDVHDMDNKA